MHGAFTIRYNTLSLKEKDQSCHHEVWMHHSHVNARLVDRVSRDDKSRRTKKRNSLATTAKKEGGVVEKAFVRLKNRSSV